MRENKQENPRNKRKQHTSIKRDFTRSSLLYAIMEDKNWWPTVRFRVNW